MDTHQRRKRYPSIGIKFIISLGVFCLLYFFLIRPIQYILVEDLIVPVLKLLSASNHDIIIQGNLDDYLIESKSNKFINLFFNLPFNADYCLAVTLIWVFGNSVIMRYVNYYNLALFIIHPIFIVLILSGNTWIAPIINAHEIVYKAIFLSLAIIGLKRN